MTHNELRPLLNERRTVGDEEISFDQSHVNEDEQKLSNAAVGERLSYNDYSTIDWMHDLVEDSYRLRRIRERKGLRHSFAKYLDEASGWVAAALIGAITACVAFLVDIAAATVSDWKLGYCSRNPFSTREACCDGISSSPDCDDFKPWNAAFGPSFLIYLALAFAYGLISVSVTLLTKTSLPATAPGTADKDPCSGTSKPPTGKSMYMAAGSGIPELKTILSGFVIPNFLDMKVLVVKAVGSVFAVSTGMCLGKEGPFVHISTCVGWQVARLFPKYRNNGRKTREMLSVACAAGLSVAFGAPLGGVLFSYEEISTYFPRKVLWKAFLCSLSAAMFLKALNPTGTGQLILFQTNYGQSYNAIHYFLFVLLGIAGGIFGGLFCRLNFAWSKWFRGFNIIKNNPIFEVLLVVLMTVLLQYPNPLTREPGDATINGLLVDCRNEASHSTYICQQEAQEDRSHYIGYLLLGTITKLILTIITFGIKVPSGVIIPALGAGALFGRLIGQITSLGISPGILAMVGSAAFLAGVSRMTLSLCVIMFELFGEIDHVLPHMMAILVAKWVADAVGKDSVYDLAQAVLGHPFLDIESSMWNVQRQGMLVAELIPPPQTMDEITVVVPQSQKVPREVLAAKLNRLRARGLMDAGLVLVASNGILQGYLAQGELEFGMSELGMGHASATTPTTTHTEVRLLGDAEEGDYDMSHFVDRTPLSVSATAPLEYAIEMFGKLGLRHLIVLEEGSGRVMGVIIKKRLVAYLDKLKHE